MINGFYAAKSGAKAFQTSLDITANNIANVNTQGYKAQSASFTDVLYTNAQGSEYLTGNGTRLAATSIDTEQGGLMQIGDGSVAIEGKGFFAVEDEGGDTVYTRSGSFSLSVEGNQTYLVLPDGGYLLNRYGQRIAVNDGDMMAAIRQAALYTFPNPGELEALGNGCYAATEASGDPALDNASQLKESAYELSNVDLAEEMTRMMLAQRGLQMNLRMLQTADELEQDANNLRG